MSGTRHRRKGGRIEREIVEAHRAFGVHAERYPLSGASRFRGSDRCPRASALARVGAPAREGAPMSARKSRIQSFAS